MQLWNNFHSLASTRVRNNADVRALLKLQVQKNFLCLKWNLKANRRKSNKQDFIACISQLRRSQEAASEQVQGCETRVLSDALRNVLSGKLLKKKIELNKLTAPHDLGDLSELWWKLWNFPLNVLSWILVIDVCPDKMRCLLSEEEDAS